MSKADSKLYSTDDDTIILFARNDLTDYSRRRKVLARISKATLICCLVSFLVLLAIVAVLWSDPSLATSSRIISRDSGMQSSATFGNGSDADAALLSDVNSEMNAGNNETSATTLISAAAAN